MNLFVTYKKNMSNPPESDSSRAEEVGEAKRDFVGVVRDSDLTGAPYSSVGVQKCRTKKNVRPTTFHNPKDTHIINVSSDSDVEHEAKKEDGFPRRRLAKLPG